MSQVEAVIFDWAGTTVDYGCMAPIYAMQEAFKQQGLSVTLEEIRQPMGMLKLDHIKTVLNMERVKSNFSAAHGRAHEQHDIETIYQTFETKIFSILHEHTAVIPGFLNVQDFLREQKIKIGSTTGYTKRMMDIVAASAASQGYKPDCIVAADEVKHGRPYPYMIYQNLQTLGVKNIERVIKVGDTIVDIAEGRNAGCYSVGVIKGSSMLGLTEAEVAELSATQLQDRVTTIKYAMLEAGADHVLETINELPWLIKLLGE